MSFPDKDLSYYRKRKLQQQLKDFTKGLMKDGIICSTGPGNENYNVEYYVDAISLINSNFGIFSPDLLSDKEYKNNND